jgi:hypothetical protein
MGKEQSAKGKWQNSAFEPLWQNAKLSVKICAICGIKSKGQIIK